MNTASAALIVAGLLTPAVADPAPGDPARALCLANGATVTIEVLPNGAKHAVCTFLDGSRIDAAAYFRNKHRTR